MKSPPLEMFHFERLVIDEYTYLNGKILSMVSKLTATRRWVLSGTPPIHDFASLKTIAAFLDIHLGVDDDGEGQSEQIKKRRREQTGTYLGSSSIYFASDSGLQMLKNSIRSAKFIAWNGTLIDIKLDKHS